MPVFSRLQIDRYPDTIVGVVPIRILLLCCAGLAFTQPRFQSADLKAQIEQVARPANGRVGIAALVLETGETFSINGDEHYPLQGVCGLPIAMTLLHEVDAGKFKLEQRISVSRKDLVPERVFSLIRDQYPRGVTLTVENLLRSMLWDNDGTAALSEAGSLQLE